MNNDVFTERVRNKSTEKKNIIIQVRQVLLLTES